MTTYVIYHADYDGEFAAFIARMGLQERGGLDNVVFTPVNYGDKFPLELDNITKHDTIYILSYLMDKSWLDEISLSAGQLFFINHMHSAVEVLADEPYAIVDDGQSSALITWGHFFPNKRPPLLAMLISDRKMGKQKHPETPQLAAWLSYAQMGSDWEKWEDLLTDQDSYNAALKYGRMLMRYQERLIDAFISRADAVLVQHGDLVRDHSSKSTKYAIYNGQTPFVTDTARAVFKKFDVDYTIDWHVDMGRDVVVFEMRSRDPEKFSVLEYAEKHEGGGQPEAAGFTMHIVDGLQLVKNLGL